MLIECCFFLLYSHSLFNFSLFLLLHSLSLHHFSLMPTHPTNAASTWRIHALWERQKKTIYIYTSIYLWLRWLVYNKMIDSVHIIHDDEKKKTKRNGRALNTLFYQSYFFSFPFLLSYFSIFMSCHVIIEFSQFHGALKKNACSLLRMIEIDDMLQNMLRIWMIMEYIYTCDHCNCTAMTCVRMLLEGK